MQVSGGSGGAMSDINVTPMIDVILVLLIIFMVITPIVQMGYLVRVPPKAPPLAPGVAPEQIIMRYMEDGTIYINKEKVDPTQFPARLQGILKGNTGKMVFFAGDPEANYQDTVEFLDLARSSGALNIGLIVEEMGAPSQTEIRLATE